LKISLQKIYPITDRVLSGLSHAEQVRQFIDGGATLIQIRDKTATSRELYDDAVEAVKLAHAAGAAIIINDRVDIAFMAGADGVHLGQDDLPPNAARRILGADAVIGVSTHSREQVEAAVAAADADYIAFGPIFSTTTKDNPDPLVGLEELARIRKLVTNVPAVAIGGINAGNLRSVLAAGADSAAMISEFYRQSSDISFRFKTLKAIAS
jgi:thiamine-phosphate pyrophosphorylase